MTRVALLTPAWFALAHVHHLLEKLFVLKSSLSSALISTAVQLTYTSIFGLIASYLYVCTGNIASPIVSHVVCNFIGLPDLGFLTESKSQSPSHLSYLYPHRLPLLCLHALGLIIFAVMLVSPILQGTLLDIRLLRLPSS
jgi:membrane protease YdiL (CAAX protease family)